MKQTILASWPFLFAGSLRIALHAFSINSYGYFGDEFYYLSCAARPDLGYVDHPPLSVWLLRIVVSMAGDSLIVIRSISAIAGVVTIWLGWLLVRSMQGNQFAALLCCTAISLAPVFMGLAKFYSMNSLDLLFWTWSIYLFIQALHSHRVGYSTWVVLGAVLGLALLNKHGILFLGAGFLLALLLLHRRWLFRPQPYVCGLVALLIFSPNLYWQIQNDWATLEFIKNAALHKNFFEPLPFLSGLILEVNPLSLPLWLGGLLVLLFGALTGNGNHREYQKRESGALKRLAYGVPDGIRMYAGAGIAVLVVFLIVFLGRGKSYYLAGIFPVLFAAGSVWLSRYPCLTLTAATCILFSGLVLSPLSLPLLSPANYRAYEATLGLSPPKFEKHSRGSMPQHFAGMFGWQTLQERVLSVHESLSDDERARSVIIGRNYFLAGALDRLHRSGRLPEVGSGHNSFYLWGPPAAGSGKADFVIFVGLDAADLQEYFDEVVPLDSIHCPECMSFRRDTSIVLARSPVKPLAELWPLLRKYD